ncbi:hypothetical protein [Microcoleus sp. herbarium2]|uniref:hypothetical protein n=1 Tax=Microcoleus sp. herbarium2 TaxID=3055433 RepID=UPI002FD5F7B2
MATCKKCRPPTAAIIPKSSRVSDYVINNDSCDDSQPSLTIADPPGALYTVGLLVPESESSKPGRAFLKPHDRNLTLAGICTSIVKTR